jgi:hypothetical protein
MPGTDVLRAMHRRMEGPTGCGSPVGLFFQSTVQQKSPTGCLKGLPIFWNVRRA